jgi:protease YdgD
MRSVRQLLGVMVLICGSAAFAEDIPSAVVRISYGDSPAPGAAICSGVLVGPDLVLTAGHCVRGAVDDPASIRFDAGWSGGKPAGRGRGAEVILSGAEGLAGDIALMVLEVPFPAEVARPIVLAGPAPDGVETGALTFHAFRRDAPDQPAAPSACTPLASRPGLLGFDCPAVSGNSGGALLQRGGNGWAVVAIMVAASASGPVRSWAVVVPEDLRQRIAAE